MRNFSCLTIVLYPLQSFDTSSKNTLLSNEKPHRFCEFRRFPNSGVVLSSQHLNHSQPQASVWHLHQPPAVVGAPSGLRSLTHFAANHWHSSPTTINYSLNELITFSTGWILYFGVPSFFFFYFYHWRWNLECYETAQPYYKIDPTHKICRHCVTWKEFAHGAGVISHYILLLVS